MTLGRCPLSIFCSRGTPPNPESIAAHIPTLSLSLHTSIRPCLVVRVTCEEKVEREKARETWRAKEGA